MGEARKYIAVDYDDLLTPSKDSRSRVANQNLKGTILKSRENNKLNKGQIMNGLTSYAQYGSINPFNNVLSNDEVKNMKSEDLIYLIKNLTNYEHAITYYGPKDLATFTADVKKDLGF